MKPALLVIDCQNDFIQNSSAYSCDMLDEALILKIKQLCEFFRSKNLPIIYTQHSIKSDKSNGEFGEPEEVKACIIGTTGWEIIDSLKPVKNDKIVLKEKYDAFYETDLHQILKKLKIDTLIIGGVLTNNCIRATAEGAHYRNYNIYLVNDCCGATSYISGMTSELIHEITLKDLKERMYSTEIINLADLGKILL